MDLKTAKKIYMIGIKGVGMTMLAQFLSSQGHWVIGSDTDEVFMTDKILKQSGIKVIEKFSRDNIPPDIDLIVYSTAYNQKTNEEVRAALKSNKIVMTYAEAMGLVFNEKFGVAVIGSHGKTTTTAWLGYILDRAGKNPNVMVGAEVPQFKGAGLTGASDTMVIEADEYQNKLKFFKPQAVILNNIEYDHPDFFPSEEEYINVFIEFIKKIPKKGWLVVNLDDPILKKISHVNCRGKVVSYAINEAADYVAYDIKHQNNQQFFKVKLGTSSLLEDEDLSDQELGDFSIKLPGRHNVYNALAVIVAATEFNIELSVIRKYLSDFTGTTRRMQVMGQYRGATIIDDYAHHPTEVKATIAAARELYGDKKLRVVFHPHTFTRTKAFLTDFAKSFTGVDEVIVLDIYGSAREEQGGVHARDLVEKISKKSEVRSQKIKYIPALEECEEYLRETVERGDIILLMGAGDVFRVGEKLVN